MKMQKKKSLMEDKEERTRKSTLIVLKDWITKDDFRRLLALIVTLGGLIVVAIRPETVSALVPLISVILAWYFKQAESENRESEA